MASEGGRRRRSGRKRRASGASPTLGVVAKTVRNFRYLDLHDEDFEELTFLLARLEEPDLVRPKAPDLGLDAEVQR